MNTPLFINSIFGRALKFENEAKVWKNPPSSSSQTKLPIEKPVLFIYFIQPPFLRKYKSYN